MTGKVYAVASGKGGVGKTTTVVNLGVTLRADEHSVALVDADLGMANLGTFLGIDHEPTLHDVLAGEASVDDALVEQVDGFAILPGARDLRQYAAADPRNLESVLEELSDRFEYVLVDTGAGVGFEDVLPLELVDEVLLVASPDRAALGDAGKTAEVSELLGVTVRGVVFTMADESDDVSAIADKMGVEHLATIPEDPSVPESTASGRPLEAFAPDGAAARGYRELAAALTGRDVAKYEPDEATDGPSATNDATSGSSEGGAPEADDDSAAAAPDATPDTAAESSEATDSTAESPEATEQTPDEVDGAAAEAASDTAGDEESSTDSTGDDRASGTEDREVQGQTESPVDPSSDPTGDSSPGDGDEPIESESTSHGDTEAPPDTDSTSRDAEAEESGAGSTDDEPESEESEGTSGGLLSRLGGLFG